MKKGFTLLETIVVITFLCVSMLLLYKTFANMVNNSKKNILYDDSSNIYKTYYLKEYLIKQDLNHLLDQHEFKEITCADFSFSSCDDLVKNLDIHKIYIVKYGVRKSANASSMLNNYLSNLSNKDDYEYRFIVEYNNKDVYSYASLGLNGDKNE